MVGEWLVCGSWFVGWLNTTPLSPFWSNTAILGEYSFFYHKKQLFGCFPTLKYPGSYAFSIVMWNGISKYFTLILFICLYVIILVFGIPTSGTLAILYIIQKTLVFYCQEDLGIFIQQVNPTPSVLKRVMPTGILSMMVWRPASSEMELRWLWNLSTNGSLTG